VSTLARRVAARTLVPLGYFALALACSWPLARDFTTYTVGDVPYDERHAIWVAWYTAQVLAGRAPWPYTTDVFFPHGASMLVNGVGPLNGVLALPFWPWGAAAAFNGATVLGLALSGWCLYALAREIGLPRGPAFVAGALYLLWPIHLIGLTGHLEKAFVGLLPLSLLAGLRAFDPDRARLWLLAPGAVLLAALLQNGNQFMFAALGLALLGVQTLWAAEAGERRARLLRLLGAAAGTAVICGPLLIAIVRVMRSPALQVALGGQAVYYSPDVLSLLVPSPHQWWTRWLFPSDTHLPDYVWASTLPGLNPTPAWYGTGLETAVAVPITAIVLGAFAWRDRRGRAWLLFGLAFALLCLGPRLRVNGTVTPMRLPYVVAKRVPGLDVMRTPGRFMLLGAVGFALAAGTGLAALGRRHPARATALVSAAAAAAAVECWPRGWQQTALPQVPPFYQRLAGERPGGAVLDLPHGWVPWNNHATAYMYFQTVHRRPIAWADLGRDYVRYPIAGIDALVEPDRPIGAALRDRLHALGYQYVVVHRYPKTFDGGWVAHGRDGRPVGPPHVPTEERLIRFAFQGVAPSYEDELVSVWTVAR
jgi:hypothetical protein